MGNVIDFDAFRAEQKQEPTAILKIGGKEYPLAPSLPAALALDIIRMNAADPDAEVNSEFLETAVRGLLGEHYDAVVRGNNLTLVELPDLIRMLFGLYNEATVPNRAARRAAGKTAAKRPTPIRSS